MMLPTMTRDQMTKVFNEWARQYAEDPDSFSEILDDKGNAVTGYGERATVTFLRILSELSDV